MKTRQPIHVNRLGEMIVEPMFQGAAHVGVGTGAGQALGLKS